MTDAHRASERLVIDAIDDAPRFVLRLPSGWTVPIASVRELLRAVAHFYRGHIPLRAECPLCHDIRLNPGGPLKNTNDPARTACIHGGLRRQCETCALADRVQELAQEVARLKAPENRCLCRNPACGHADIFHTVDVGSLRGEMRCIVPDCRCGPGGWT